MAAINSFLIDIMVQECIFGYGWDAVYHGAEKYFTPEGIRKVRAYYGG